MFYRLPPPGHQAYYNKYINVKRGGIGGVAMFIGGYIVLSYVWEYEHLSKNHPPPEGLRTIINLRQYVLLIVVFSV